MSYLKAIQKTIDHIELHLSEDLDIDHLSKQSGFSKWHFQRIFHACVGDTVSEYISKRRLSVASEKLLQENLGILEVALEAGFSSHESFSRAFKRLFHVSPKEYRQTKGEKASFPKPRITLEYLQHLYKGVSMEPKIIDVKESLVVGMECFFTPILKPNSDSFQVIPKLWGQFFSQFSKIEGISGPTVGVIHCEEEDKNSEGKIRYLAGVQVENEKVKIPEGMKLSKIPPGKYAEFTHKGKMENLEKTINFVYGSWFPSSSYQRAEGPEIEIYPDDFDPMSDQSEMKYLLPVLKV